MRENKMHWKDKLSKLVAYYEEHDSASLSDEMRVYDPSSSENIQWPENLPFNEDIKAFYEICGGGEFGPMLRFVPLSKLLEHTKSWESTLSDYDERDNIINSEQHLVIANDADGTPWILNTKTNVVASFYWKVGDWEEPAFSNFSQFMEYVFTPEEDDEDWKETLNVVLPKSA